MRTALSITRPAESPVQARGSALGAFTSALSGMAGRIGTALSMRGPSERASGRVSYTDVIVDAITAAAMGRGGPGLPSATEAVSRLVGRAMMAAEVTGAPGLTPAAMQMIGRQIVLRGEALFAFYAPDELLPVATWDVNGGAPAFVLGLPLRHARAFRPDHRRPGVDRGSARSDRPAGRPALAGNLPGAERDRPVGGGGGFVVGRRVQHSADPDRSAARGGQQGARRRAQGCAGGERRQGVDAEDDRRRRSRRQGGGPVDRLATAARGPRSPSGSGAGSRRRRKPLVGRLGGPPGLDAGGSHLRGHARSAPADSDRYPRPLCAGGRGSRPAYLAAGEGSLPAPHRRCSAHGAGGADAHSARGRPRRRARHGGVHGAAEDEPEARPRARRGPE